MSFSRDPVPGVVRLLRVFQQNARLQLRPVLLADPGQFQLLLLGHALAFLSFKSLLMLVACPEQIHKPQELSSLLALRGVLQGCICGHGGRSLCWLLHTALQ